MPSARPHSPRRGPPARGRPAFTLVELLTVVAIAAILAALLMPSLRKARELSRRGACSANQRNIVTAASQYAGENKGYLPGKGIADRWMQDPDYVLNEKMRNMWVGYLQDLDQPPSPIFWCPSFASGIRTPQQDWPRQMSWGKTWRWGYCYFANYTWADGRECSNWVSPIPSATNVNTARAGSIITGDLCRGIVGEAWGMVAHGPFGSVGPTTVAGSEVLPGGPPWWPGASPDSENTRPEGSNCSHLDGSVRFYPYSELVYTVHNYFLAGLRPDDAPSLGGT